jgi:mRNA interferase RelE/StbE
LALYKLLILSDAEAFLKQLSFSDRDHFVRIRNIIASLQKDPFQGKALKHTLKGSYSLRAGVYRIIYTVDHKIITVYVLDIGHRKDIYRS